MEAAEFARLVDDICAVRGRGGQGRLADEVLCHPRTIGRYKTGERRLRADIADKVRAIWHREVEEPGYARQLDEQRKEAGDY